MATAAHVIWFSREGLYVRNARKPSFSSVCPSSLAQVLQQSNICCCCCAAPCFSSQVALKKVIGQTFDHAVASVPSGSLWGVSPWQLKHLKDHQYLSSSNGILGSLQPLSRPLPLATTTTVLNPCDSATLCSLEAYARQRAHLLPKVVRVLSSADGRAVERQLVAPSEWLFYNRRKPTAPARLPFSSKLLLRAGGHPTHHHW